GGNICFVYLWCWVCWLGRSAQRRHKVITTLRSTTPTPFVHVLSGLASLSEGFSIAPWSVFYRVVSGTRWIDPAAHHTRRRHLRLLPRSRLHGIDVRVHSRSKRGIYRYQCASVHEQRCDSGRQHNRWTLQRIKIDAVSYSWFCNAERKFPDL